MIMKIVSVPCRRVSRSLSPLKAYHGCSSSSTTTTRSNVVYRYSYLHLNQLLLTCLVHSSSSRLMDGRSCCSRYSATTVHWLQNRTFSNDAKNDKDTDVMNDNSRNSRSSIIKNSNSDKINNSTSNIDKQRPGGDLDSSSSSSGKAFDTTEHDKFYASMGAHFKVERPNIIHSSTTSQRPSETNAPIQSNDSKDEHGPSSGDIIDRGPQGPPNADGSYPWRAATAIGSATMQLPHEINRYYAQMESSLMKRINESNKRRFRIGFLATVTFFIWVSMVYGEQIKETIKAKFFGIAQETLENETLKVQTQELAMAVVQTILNDENIANHAATFLKTACSSQETRRALVDLTLHVLAHPETEKELMVLVRKLVNNASQDKDVLEKITALFVTAIADERVLASLSILFRKLAEDEDVLMATSVLAEKVFSKQIVCDATLKLLSDSTEKVFENDDVILKSREFVADVMGDDAIQREGGDALWNSVSHALTPGIRRIGGMCLIGVSVAAIKLLLSPY